MSIARRFAGWTVCLCSLFMAGCVGFAVCRGLSDHLPFQLADDRPHIIYHLPAEGALTLPERAVIAAQAKAQCPPGMDWQVWIDKRTHDVFIVYLGD